MIKDLTVGDEKSVLWKFSIPMFISVVFQQLYSIADSIIAGKFVGEEALAAVGASYPITMIFMAIAVGSNIGCGVVISRLFGGKKYKDMKTAISTTIIAAFVLSIFLSVLGVATSKYLMVLVNTPQDIFRDGRLYLQIYIGGFLFLFLYNIATGIFTSLGDSKTPLIFLIASSIANVLLDLLFVIQFQWGVQGVAWATFAAQGASCILALITVKKRVSAIHSEGKYEKFSFVMLGKIGYIAVPSILQQSFISIGNIFIQRIINNYGSSVIAGYSAAIKLNTFAITSFTTLGNGVSSFTSQNIGAGKPERVKKGFLAGVRMAVYVAIPVVILFVFMGDPLIALFLKKKTSQALVTGRMFLRIVSPFYFVILVKLLADGVLRGGGAMNAFMISTFTDLILRVVLSYILSSFLGTNGIWMSWPIGWSVATILSVAFYMSGSWKKQM